MKKESFIFFSLALLGIFLIIFGIYQMMPFANNEKNTVLSFPFVVLGIVIFGIGSIYEGIKIQKNTPPKALKEFLIYVAFGTGTWLVFKLMFTLFKK